VVCDVDGMFTDDGLAYDREFSDALLAMSELDGGV
jgi:hypothetical protein